MTLERNPSAVLQTTTQSTPVGLGLQLLFVADQPAEWLELATLVPFGSRTQAKSATSVEQALSMGASRAADVVLLVVPFAGTNGLELCRQMQSVRAVPIVIVGERLDLSLLERAPQSGICGFVSRSTFVPALPSMVSIGLQWILDRTRLVADRDRMAEQNRQLLETLENRKIIERAKGIYMRLLGMQEADAHRRLQQESQKRRLALVDLAKKIIESDELLGPGK